MQAAFTKIENKDKRALVENLESEVYLFNFVKKITLKIIMFYFRLFISQRIVFFNYHKFFVS